MKKVKQKILKEQREWADSKGLKRYKNTLERVEDNLYQDLNPATKEDLSKGAGNELKGKMRVLNSSAVLVSNFFDYWREQDLTPLLESMEITENSSQYDKFEFESKMSKPAGIPGQPAHLDLEFSGEEVIPIAVESKFTEIYDKYEKKELGEAYDKNWNWPELRQCKELVHRLVMGESEFQYLNGVQLMTHIVGLLTEYGPGNFKLVYLWHEKEGKIAEKHKAEVSTFADKIRSEVDFESLTYQELFANLQNNLRSSAHQPYFDYLKERYF